LAVDDKRKGILEAARKRFRHYGVRKTTMHEIARDAGIAVGTLYLYFKDKDDLLVACTDEYVIRHRRQAEAILASDASAADKLRRYVLDRFRASQATRAGGFRPAAELQREVLRVRPERRLEEGRMMADYFVRILRLGMETGELNCDHPERDARVLLLSLAFLFPLEIDEGAYTPTEEDALMVVDWFLQVWQQSDASPASGKRPR
jgi:TetR/AcrR family fatty acid metabolism transcriptional regulator